MVTLPTDLTEIKKGHTVLLEVDAIVTTAQGDLVFEVSNPLGYGVGEKGEN